jgi:DNA-binding NarL/FixJ family response regulator
MNGWEPHMSGRRIRVLCVDDHELIREGMKSILCSQPDIEMLASAATGEHAIELYRELRPDVTLMDLRLPVMSGVTATKTILAEDPDARIIVLTTYDSGEDISRALEAGAATYLLKEALSDDLVRMVRDVHAGRRPMPLTPAGTAVRAKSALTPREADVLKLVARGLRNKEIANLLGVSEETVKTHIKGLLAKLGARDRTGAIALAVNQGLLKLP